MKTKIIVSLFFLFLLGTNLFAQENKTDLREKFFLGVKAGANYSNVFNTRGEQFVADGKFGFAAGVFAAIPMGMYIGFQPEILFSQKGFKGTGIILGSKYVFSRTTNYLDIPLFFSLKPSEFLSLQMGPQFSYLMKQKDVFSSGNTSTEQQQEFSNDNIRKNTLCFVGGININIKHLVFGVRAGWDMMNNNGDGTSTAPRYQNVWYQATIGTGFINRIIN